MTEIENTNSSYPMEGRCNARNRKGEPCKKHPVTGRTRCALHGGKTLQGEAHGRYKFGLYTKEMLEMRREIRQDLRRFKEYMQMIL